MKGVVLENGSKFPLDSVAVSEHNILLNSYPFPSSYSNKSGQYTFEKEIKDSVLYFYKAGYEILRVKFDNNSILNNGVDTVYLFKNK
jgi:hypothetical protein